MQEYCSLHIKKLKHTSFSFFLARVRPGAADSAAGSADAVKAKNLKVRDGSVSVPEKVQPLAGV
jgi:hypothetical protein